MEITLMWSEKLSNQNDQTIPMNLVFQNVQESKTMIKHFDLINARMKTSREIIISIHAFQS